MGIIPKSKQESEETSPAQMVEVISSKTKHREHLMTASDRVQEEQVDIEVTVEGEEGTSTKKQDNQIVGDTARLEKLVNDNYVSSGDNNDNNEQNEAPNLVPSCEKEAKSTLDNDNESVSWMNYCNQKIGSRLMRLWNVNVVSDLRCA